MYWTTLEKTTLKLESVVRLAVKESIMNSNNTFVLCFNLKIIIQIRPNNKLYNHLSQIIFKKFTIVRFKNALNDLIFNIIKTTNKQTITNLKKHNENDKKVNMIIMG